MFKIHDTTLQDMHTGCLNFVGKRQILTRYEKKSKLIITTRTVNSSQNYTTRVYRIKGLILKYFLKKKNL